MVEDLYKVVYWIDDRDTIVQVNQAWDEFAIANGANGSVLAHNIPGRNLFDCIVGDASRRHLAVLLSGVRTTGEPNSLSYRCDSPAVMRFMKMVTTLEGDGRVRFSHQIVRQLRIYPAITYHYSPGDVEAVIQCNNCSRIRVRDAWYEGMDLFADDPARAEISVPVQYDICPACEIIPLQPTEPSAPALMV